MTTARKSVPAQAAAAEELFLRVIAILKRARSQAARAVNREMVAAYWLVGREIVEHERGGKRRAAYGEAVLEELSRRLTASFGRGFDVRNLRYMRQFYLTFPAPKPLAGCTDMGRNRDAPRAESAVAVKRNALRSELPALPPELSWTHYRLLLGVEDPAAREWYMREAASQGWSSRQLERQISVLYFERLLGSRKKEPVRREARRQLAAVASEDFIRDPYGIEFLNLGDYPALRESTVEQAIIDNLQAFLLELHRPLRRDNEE